MRYQTRASRFVLREILLFIVAAAASVVFLNHENLYLRRGFELTTGHIEPYLLVTGVLYLFVRFVVLAVELRPPRVHAELVRCPECGQWIDDATSAGADVHRKVVRDSSPARKAVAPVGALRRAVDASRFGTHAREGKRIGEDAAAPPMPPNITGRELVEGLTNPDFADRVHHGPQPANERRLKR